MGTVTLQRPAQLPARLVVDEAIKTVIAVGSCLSKRQQKELVLEVWANWQRIAATTKPLLQGEPPHFNAHEFPDGDVLPCIALYCLVLPLRKSGSGLHHGSQHVFRCSFY